MRQSANATNNLQQFQNPVTAKTAKSSLNTNEKASSKLVLTKGSTEKKVKSRATSNNKP